MDDYTWRTDESHSDNSETMNDYLDNEMDQTWEIIMVDGTYAEIVTYDQGDKYGVHASGDGDSFSHRISFESLD